MNPTKRRKIEPNYYDILSDDLEVWRAKLCKTSSAQSEFEYKLLFFSTGCYDTLEPLSGYSPTIREEWSAKTWHEARQNKGPAVITYSYSVEALTPPALAAQRLQLFGFVYVICPTIIKIPNTLEDLRRSIYKHYLYGCPGLFNPSHRKVSLDIVNKELDMEDPAHVQEAYDYLNIVNTSLAVERPLLMQLEHLEREYKEKKKLLFEMIKTVNNSRRSRVVSKQKLNVS